MTEQEKREKVIRGLECCNETNTSEVCPCPYQPSHKSDMCLFELHADALALLKRSFTPTEVYDTVIEHAQHDMRFKLGDKIDYSFTDVVDILNIELMCKAGDM